LFGECCRRGLGAVRDLRRGEIVLRVPKSALMTIDSVMEDKKLCFAVNRHSCLSSAQVSFLAVYSVACYVYVVPVF